MTKKIFIIPVVMKDWKESWKVKDFKEVVKVYKETQGNILEIKEHGRTDSDIIYIFKGIDEEDLIDLDDEFGPYIDDKIEGNDLLDIKEQLNEKAQYFNEQFENE